MADFDFIGMQTDTFMGLCELKVKQNSCFVVDDNQYSVPVAMTIFMNSTANTITEYDQQMMLQFIKKYAYLEADPTMTIPGAGYSLLRGVITGIPAFSNLEKDLTSTIDAIRECYTAQTGQSLVTNTFNLSSTLISRGLYDAANHFLKNKYPIDKIKNSESLIDSLPGAGTDLNSNLKRQFVENRKNSIYEMAANSHIDVTHKFRGVTTMDRLLTAGLTSMFDSLANIELNKKIQIASQNAENKLSESDRQSLVATITRTRRI